MDHGTVFISYRRDDSPGSAGRLYDRLVSGLDRDAVFFDVDNIAPGVDFVEVLNDRVGACDALIAIIGKKWSSVESEGGGRRLDDPNDFVRIEIEAALSRGVRVIPVLVDGATMPRETAVPPTLQPLLRRQAILLSHERFDSDADRIIRSLKRIFIDRGEAARLAEERRQQAEEGERVRQQEAARLAEAECRRAEAAEPARQAEVARLAADQRRAEDETQKAAELEPVRPAAEQPRDVARIADDRHPVIAAQPAARQASGVPRLSAVLVAAVCGAILAIGGTTVFQMQRAAPIVAPDQAAKDQAAKDQAAKDQAAKDQAAKEQAAKDQAAKEQAAKDQAAKEQAAKDQAAKEQAAKDQAAKEQAAKDQAAKNQVAKDQAAARQRAVRDQANREQAARKRELDEQAKLERELRARAAAAAERKLKLHAQRAPSTARAQKVRYAKPSSGSGSAAPSSPAWGYTYQQSMQGQRVGGSNAVTPR